MSKEPIIETERLILRPITLEDAEVCFNWNSDERVTRFMSYSTLTDISQTIDWIKSTLVDKNEWNWAFVLKEGNRVIGTGSIGPDAKMEGYWGMGYNLNYDFWNKGYATEAMKAIINFVYRELGITKICACYAVENPASGRVMEKCGLKFFKNGEYTKTDGSETFKAKFYKIEL